MVNNLIIDIYGKTMMKTFLTIFALVIIAGVTFAQESKEFNYFERIDFTVSNQADHDLVDAPVMIKMKDLKEDSDFNPYGFILYRGEKEIPSQHYNNGNDCFIVFTTDLKKGETAEFHFKYLHEGKIVKNYKNRTYAELAMKFDAIYKNKKFTSDHFENFTKVVVPEIHTDHDALFKYEGPGWESEKVGYRFYLDWRNATDIFGKTVNELVLHKVGTNDVVAKDDSYHEMQEWGMDIFKVGSSLGIGSIGMKTAEKIEAVSKTDGITCEIKFNGPVLSEVITEYKGWEVSGNKYDLTARLSITAGSRITTTCLNITEDAKNITTGLAKHENTEFMKSDVDGDWQYIALYGKQTLADDDLGIVLFYKKSALIEQGEDEINYFVSLKPVENKVIYKYAAAWVQEPGGIKSKEEFNKYINEKLNEFNNPLNIEIK